MPFLNKPKRRFAPKYKKHDKQGEIQKIYNTSKWKKIRQSYLMEHPLCEVCLSNDVVTEAFDVHHIREISNGDTFEEMLDIAYNSDNLMSVCRSCHSQIHKNRHREMNNEKNK